jgi:hypothetical protein
MPPKKRTTEDAVEIRVQGHLDTTWAAWFDRLRVTNQPGGTALLRGPVRDQAELMAAPRRLHDLDLRLTDVRWPAHP